MARNLRQGAQGVHVASFVWFELVGPVVVSKGKL
jgi:hypothetical protein